MMGKAHDTLLQYIGIIQIKSAMDSNSATALYWPKSMGPSAFLSHNRIEVHYFSSKKIQKENETLKHYIFLTFSFQ